MEENLSTGNYNLTENDNSDLKRYLSLFISNWYWFAVSLFISGALSYGINRYSEKIFTVSSTLLIKDDQIGNLNGNTTSIIPGGDIFKRVQNLKNEMGILKSNSLNYKAIEKLEEFHVTYVSIGRRGIVESRMYKTCPFKVVYDSLEKEPKGIKVGITIIDNQNFIIDLDAEKQIQRTKKFGEKFSEFGFDFTIVQRNAKNPVYNKNNSNKYYFYFEDLRRIASEYQSKISVNPIEKDASLVTLSVSGPLPEQESDYLNKLMETYILNGLDIKNQTADSTIKFIDSQLKVVSDSLLIAEAVLENFRLKNSFIDLTKEGLLIQNRLEKLENEKTAFEMQLQYYNYLSDYLELNHPAGAIISPSVMGITDQVLIKLVGEITSYQKEMEKVGFNIVGDQPAFKLMFKQTQEAHDALKENVRNGITNLKLLLTESEKKISEVEVDINKLPSTERKLINIQRKFDLNNTVYTYLLEKRSESGIAKASNVSDNRIIDTATYFSAIQVKPKSRMNLLIALLMGLMIPISAISLIDYFNNKIIDKSDVERKTKVPVIGYIGHSDGKNEIPVVEKPGSSLAESFRSVRTAIKYFVTENEVAVIAVSSTVSSEGKTFISINLAAITAMLGKRVLLIGLDLRKPRINKVFEFEDSPGMSTFLSNNCEYEEIIKNTQIKNLFYAPSGPIPPNPSELIDTELMKDFLNKARKEFDYIFIDTPPVAIVTDALLLARYVDVNLFIVRQRYSSRNTLEMIEHMRAQGEFKNMAIVINDISLSGYYGYGMRYGNAYGYGYSYGYNYYGSNYYRNNSDKDRGYYIED